MLPSHICGQTINPFKDRWNKRHNDWKKHWNTRDIDDKNDHAALLKHYISVHSDAQNVCQEISAAWKVAFLEEPSSYLLDMRETHWRGMLEDKSSLVNLQRMWWPRVK